MPPLDFIRHKIRQRRHEKQTGRKRTGTLLKWVWYSLFTLLLVMLAGAISLTIFLIIIVKDLPSPEELLAWNVAQSTKIYDRESNLLYELHGDERRTVITLDEMPQFFIDATLVAEDANFYEHPGYSWKGIIRAAYLDVKRKITGSGYVQGGSTITQQFVKNSYLTSEKTITRKLKELILSMQVENYYTKDQILEMYLNKIPYGSNAHGVESASQIYFDKEASELSIAESAVLAALPQAPSYYSPYGSHTDDLTRRKEWVIDRMLELGKITYDQSEKAKEEELIFVPYREEIKYPHFVFYVREQLEEFYPNEVIIQGGLQVYTTIDPKIQDKLEEEISNGVEGSRLQNYGATNSAGVALDPKTGQILAMVGSSDYFDTEYDGQVNVTTSYRAPGSSFKPYVYASVFSKAKGIGPGTVTYDLKTNFGSNYEPENFEGGFWGPVSLRRALGGSRNVPAVKVGHLAGVEDTLDMVNKMGLENLSRADASRTGLSYALGTTEVRMLDHAKAYGVFATGGAKYPTTPFLKILDNQGQILQEFEQPEGEEVLDPQAAYLISDILSDPSARPAGWGNLNVSGFRVAAKTGTSSKEVEGKSLPLDLWTVGYTPNFVLAVWAGNNDGTPLTLGASALMGVSPIWKAVMTEALPNRPVEDFTRPEQIKSVAISKISGFLPSSGTPSEQVTTDIFADYSVPTMYDKGFISAKVDSTTGEIATEFCPEHAIVTYVYENRHDILYYINPDDPQNERWEGPVRNWARSHIGGVTDGTEESDQVEETVSEGEAVDSVVDTSNIIYVDSPDKIPTEECHVHNEKTQGDVPIVTILSPTRIVAGINKVTLDIDYKRSLERVEFYFDDQLQDTVNKYPYDEGQIIVPEGLELGSTHTIKVYVFDRVENRGETSVPVIVALDNTPPEVEFLSPSGYKRYDRGDEVSVLVEASDNKGNVSKVEIYLDDKELLQTLNIAPYQFIFTVSSKTSSGKHTLKARAYDNEGNIGTETQEFRVSYSSSSNDDEPEEEEEEPPPIEELSGELLIENSTVSLGDDPVLIKLKITGDNTKVKQANIFVNGTEFKTFDTVLSYNDIFWEVADELGSYYFSAQLIKNDGESFVVEGKTVTVE